jgi:hypothetical protein
MADDEMKIPLESSSDDQLPGPRFAGVTVIAQPQPMMSIPVPGGGYKTGDLAPHSFMALAIIVAIFCGVLYVVSLMCSIPAIVLSYVVREFKL